MGDDERTADDDVPPAESEPRSEEPGDEHPDEEVHDPDPSAGGP